MASATHDRELHRMVEAVEHALAQQMSALKLEIFGQHVPKPREGSSSLWRRAREWRDRSGLALSLSVEPASFSSGGAGWAQEGEELLLELAIRIPLAKPMSREAVEEIARAAANALPRCPEGMEVPLDYPSCEMRHPRVPRLLWSVDDRFEERLNGEMQVQWIAVAVPAGHGPTHLRPAAEVSQELAFAMASVLEAFRYIRMMYGKGHEACVESNALVGWCGEYLFHKEHLGARWCSAWRSPYDFDLAAHPIEVKSSRLGLPDEALFSREEITFAFGHRDTHQVAPIHVCIDEATLTELRKILMTAALAEPAKNEVSERPLWLTSFAHTFGVHPARVATQRDELESVLERVQGRVGLPVTVFGRDAYAPLEKAIRVIGGGAICVRLP